MKKTQGSSSATNFGRLRNGHSLRGILQSLLLNNIQEHSQSDFCRQIEEATDLEGLLRTPGVGHRLNFHALDCPTCAVLVRPLWEQAVAQLSPAKRNDFQKLKRLLEPAQRSLLTPRTTQTCPSPKTATIESPLTKDFRALTALSPGSDVQSACELAARLVRVLVRFDTFAILLVGPGGEYLRVRFTIGYPGGIVGKWVFGPGQGIVGTVLKTGKAIRVGNVHTDSRHFDGGRTIAAELALPLLANNSLIGVLDLGSDHVDYFTQRDQERIGFFAQHIANAIDRTEKDAERRRSELLSSIHEATVVREVLSVAGLEVAFHSAPFQPADLGADFYYFRPSENSRVALAVGDVEGRAPFAALQGSVALGTFLEHNTLRASPPSQLLAQMNRYLHSPEEDGLFARLNVVQYDARERTISLSNAGSPPPLFSHRGVVTTIRPSGPPLGIKSNSRYSEQDIRLQTGDLIVMYSDGMNEANRANRRVFERVSSMVTESEGKASAKETIQMLVRGTDELMQAGEDRTIVAIKAV